MADLDVLGAQIQTGYYNYDVTRNILVRLQVIMAVSMPSVIL
jgi:hypothetical protein